MHAIRWHIGCSGFHYKEWKERFYPKGLPQRLWFEHYAKHFNTLELNVTFYRFPTLQSLTSWYQKAPDGFTFSAKVPRTVTHYGKFVNTQVIIDDFYAVLQEGLKEKLGCVLFQLPPQWTYSDERLEQMLAQMDFSFRNVIEFRHESWWRPDVMQRMAQNGVSFCGVSFPKISRDDSIINTSLVYYRFHGVPVLFHSEYDNDMLHRVATQIAANELTREAYVYFNNTASMAAVANAMQFRQMTHGI